MPELARESGVLCGTLKRSLLHPGITKVNQQMPGVAKNMTHMVTHGGMHPADSYRRGYHNLRYN
jgi:hypothetical protein